jgi:hypothetical protein
MVQSGALKFMKAEPSSTFLVHDQMEMTRRPQTAGPLKSADIAVMSLNCAVPVSARNPVTCG